MSHLQLVASASTPTGGVTHRASKGEPGSSQWLIPLACLLVWLAFIPASHRQAHKYTWDSAAYIECAQSLVRGEGLMHRAIGGIELPHWEPLALWPPGYPILMAIVHGVGVSAPEAGVWVSLLSAAVFVLLQAWVCQRLLHWIVALPVALAATCMPALYQVSTNCLSDAAFMAVSVGSLASLIVWSDRSVKHWSWLVAAGLMAGFAYAIRTVGIALMVAEVGFLLVCLTEQSWRGRFRIVAIWLAAVSVLVAPVLIRNLAVFGSLNPYEMPPSNLSLWDNVRATWLALKQDLTASRWLANVVAHKYVLGGAVMIAGIGWWRQRGVLSFSRAGHLLAEQRWCILVFGYAAALIGVVIAGRTKYWWGEPIYWRYLIPVYWVALIGVAVLVGAVFRAVRLPGRLCSIALCALFVGVAALQARAQIIWLRQPPSLHGSLASTVGHDTGRLLASLIPAHQFVLACRADLLRIHCDVNARKIPGPPFSDARYRRALTWEEVSFAGQAGHLWGIVIEDVLRAREGGYLPWMQTLLTNPEQFPELQRVNAESPAHIFKYVARR